MEFECTPRCSPRSKVQSAFQCPRSVDLTCISEPPTSSPYQIANLYLRTARIHSDELDRILRSLRYQNEALRIASSALDLHVLAIADAFDGITSGAQHELDKQASLLAGVEADLEIASRVAIHTEFLSESYKQAMETGQKARTLGDYVSQPKMRQVADTCRRTHGSY